MGCAAATSTCPGRAATLTRPATCSTHAQWAGKRSEFCVLTGKASDAVKALEQGQAELGAALEDLYDVLASAASKDVGAVRWTMTGIW
jgi:hypothetical protein